MSYEITTGSQFYYFVDKKQRVIPSTDVSGNTTNPTYFLNLGDLSMYVVDYYEYHDKNGDYPDRLQTWKAGMLAKYCLGIKYGDEILYANQFYDDINIQTYIRPVFATEITRGELVDTIARDVQIGVLYRVTSGYTVTGNNLLPGWLDGAIESGFIEEPRKRTREADDIAE